MCCIQGELLYINGPHWVDLNMDLNMGNFHIEP